MFTETDFNYQQYNDRDYAVLHCVELNDSMPAKVRYAVLRGQCPINEWHQNELMLGLVADGYEDVEVDVVKFAYKTRRAVNHLNDRMASMGLKRIVLLSLSALAIAACSLAMSVDSQMEAEPVVVSETVPFWFKNEVHYMTSEAHRFQLDWWERKAAKANPEELTLCKEYLDNLPTVMYQLPNAKDRVRQVKAVISERLAQLQGATYPAD